jgi:uncharacterized beta-barrel protein YwiB (DUF1934 family)
MKNLRVNIQISQKAAYDQTEKRKTDLRTPGKWKGSATCDG